MVEKATRQPDFLIEQLLPSREVHLLGGPSGAGKTTWLFQTLKEQWRLGGEILGQRVHPVPFVYISADRSRAGVERTMRRTGADSLQVPFLSLINHPEITSVSNLVEHIHRNKPETKLFIVDGVMRLTPGRASGSIDGGFAAISRFLALLCKQCEDHDITMLLIVHSPKQKEDGRYANPRERVMGSAAWAAFVETIILVEPYLPISRDTLNARTLICLPRNSSPVMQDLEFNRDGRLIERVEELDEVLVQQFLQKLPEGSVFTTEAILEALSARMGRTTVFRWLSRLEADGRITRVCQGRYRHNRLA